MPSNIAVGYGECMQAPMGAYLEVRLFPVKHRRAFKVRRYPKALDLRVIGYLERLFECLYRFRWQ